MIRVPLKENRIRLQLNDASVANGPSFTGNEMRGSSPQKVQAERRGEKSKVNIIVLTSGSPRTATTAYRFGGSFWCLAGQFQKDASVFESCACMFRAHTRMHSYRKKVEMKACPDPFDGLDARGAWAQNVFTLCACT